MFNFTHVDLLLHTDEETKVPLEFQQDILELSWMRRKIKHGKHG